MVKQIVQSKAKALVGICCEMKQICFPCSFIVTWTSFASLSYYLISLHENSKEVGPFVP